MSFGIGRRRSSDPALLWLWCRMAAVALIQLLAWEPPYAEGAALKKTKKIKIKKRERLVTYKRVDRIGVEVVVGE